MLKICSQEGGKGLKQRIRVRCFFTARLGFFFSSSAVMGGLYSLFPLGRAKQGFLGVFYFILVQAVLVLLSLYIRTSCMFML